MNSTKSSVNNNIELTDLSVFEYAFTCMESDIVVTQSARIKSILTDDTEGSRHQRFIVELENGQSLMVVQNIDIAPKIPNPEIGKMLTFHGDYEWNAKGGVIHWTHRDPDGKHIHGWIEYDGIRYQ